MRVHRTSQQQSLQLTSSNCVNKLRQFSSCNSIIALVTLRVLKLLVSPVGASWRQYGRTLWKIVSEFKSAVQSSVGAISMSFR